MDLSQALFNFYKKFGTLLRIVLCPLLLVCFILWIIGNFVHLNTLFMFVIGLVVASVLMYFYGGAIYGYIDKIVVAIQNIWQELLALM